MDRACGGEPGLRLYREALAARFTHDISPGAEGSAIAATTAEDEHAVRAGFDVLRDAGKLNAVLLQFPFSFHRTPETVAHLTALLKRFADYPLVVEVRHASWQTPETFALLAESNAGFCNIDQPIIGRSIEPSAETTSPIGYVRLHGRRYDTWFSDDPEIPSHERYNYLYSPEELAPWAKRVQKLAERSRQVFVITNNHYQGKGVVNALQLISILKGSKVKVPEPLRQHPSLSWRPSPMRRRRSEFVSIETQQTEACATCQVRGTPHPGFSVRADSTGVTGVFYGSAGGKRVRGGRTEKCQRGLWLRRYIPGVLQKVL